MATRPAAEAPPAVCSPGRVGVDLPVHRGEFAASGDRWAGGEAPRLVIHLVPYRYRLVHRLYAAVFRRFWWPCAACGESFGGQEWRDAGGRPATIPAPAHPVEVLALGHAGLAICPPCTLADVGRHRWALLDRRGGSRLATAAEVDDHRRPPYEDDERRQDGGAW